MLVEKRNLTITNVSLSNLVKYNTKFFVGGVRINMRCGYNTRNKSRWVILNTDDGKVLLSQTFLEYGRRCELNFNAEFLNLHYYVTLKPKDTNRKISGKYDYLNWAKDFDICFVGLPQSLKEKEFESIRKYLVGN